MKKLILLIFVTISVKSFSQETPKVVLKDSSQLRLSHLTVNVKITGNIATTSYDMKFYNELDRTLEGELAFPLGQGQSVSRFAMDVNGKLREAVVVEKELARVAFENTVRQNIDPGLLEKTQGNNYKARVYPILPNTYKHIVITYEQELLTSNEVQTYELPLSIKKSLDEFTVNIEVYGGESLPIIKNNSHENFFFIKNNGFYAAKLIKQNHTPNTPIVVQIPNTSDSEKLMSYKDYFYAYKVLEPNVRLKSKPKKITLLWDASYSLKNRNLEQELKLLENYFNYLQNVEVQFISFNNDIRVNKTVVVNGGDWEEIEKLIGNTNYDGGTSFDLFNRLKIKTDETLLFTDGLSNLGDFSSINNRAVYTINSTVSANHDNLNTIATNSGGNYINLIRIPYTQALGILKQETFQFLGVKHNNSVREVYPFKNTNVTSDFSITGRFSEDTTIELLFGYQGKVVKRIPVTIKKSDGTKLVKRLWAKQKLKFLKENKEQNKESIISLATQYSLVTDYTSMLILDRIEDYVRYRIEPPQELKQEYKRLIKEIDTEQANKQEELNDRKDELFEDYADIMEWYKTKYPKKKTIKAKKTTLNISNQSISQTENNQTSANTDTTTNRESTISSENTRTIEIDSTKRIISGTVLDGERQPLVGANIIVKGTSNGTQTDFDGNFSINADENEELEFSYIGFTSTIVRVGNTNSINISLNEDTATLDEVVVTALGVKRESQSLGYSISKVAYQSLSGKVSGVDVTGQPGASSSVTIRGNASFSNSQPLYIVDGVITTNNPTISLEPQDIDSMQILNAENATKLYGSLATNGLIIVTTKKGKEANREEINELNKQISEKIELKSWNPNTPYIKILESESTVELAYKKYLEIRNEYSNSPSFFLDVSDFFDKKNSPQIAITILTNLIEVELDNHELMKALAYKLEYFKKYELAIIIYRKVLALRPEEPQSYRDLALAYELDGKYQKSFDLLYKIYNGELLQKDEEERYYGIEHIAFVELTRLVTKHKLKLNNEQENYFNKIPVDIRVIVDWNHNDTDIDLWVIDPNGEKAYYKNSETKLGGRMSEDLTEGYGPEEFMLKNAIKGNYKIMIDYYSDNVQKISGPTNLKVTLFTNYGKSNEKKETIIVRLDKEEDEIEVGNLTFD